MTIHLNIAISSVEGNASLSCCLLLFFSYSLKQESLHRISAQSSAVGAQLQLGVLFITIWDLMERQLRCLEHIDVTESCHVFEWGYFSMSMPPIADQQGGRRHAFKAIETYFHTVKIDWLHWTFKGQSFLTSHSPQLATVTAPLCIIRCLQLTTMPSCLRLFQLWSCNSCKATCQYCNICLIESSEQIMFYDFILVLMFALFSLSFSSVKRVQLFQRAVSLEFS